MENKYSDEQINDFVSKIQEKPNHAMIQALYFTKFQFFKEEKKLEEKLRWYLITLDDILNTPDILSKEEKTEFINIHLAYVKKHKNLKVRQ